MKYEYGSAFFVVVRNIMKELEFGCRVDPDARSCEV